MDIEDKGVGRVKRKDAFCLFPHIILMMAALYLSSFLMGCTLKGTIGRNTSQEVPVVFTYTGVAEAVCISGDFNGWSPDAHCLRRNGDTWNIRLSLTPGRYRYTFLVDNIHWIPDPNAFLQEDDGFGMKNSILIVD
jgi:1,4-alpha-glucan branching enzyme